MDFTIVSHHIQIPNRFRTVVDFHGIFYDLWQTYNTSKYIHSKIRMVKSQFRSMIFARKLHLVDIVDTLGIAPETSHDFPMIFPWFSPWSSRFCHKCWIRQIARSWTWSRSWTTSRQPSRWSRWRCGSNVLKGTPRVPQEELVNTWFS